MSRPTAYSLASYGSMISDRPRMTAYAEALRRTVRPGSVVVDIGAGTGIFSLLACQLGAKHVHAIEPDASIETARTIAAANGFGERITFHRAISTDVEIPEPADVIVSDLRGVVPLLQHHIASIADARTRLLARDGTLIPRRDTLRVSLIEAPEIYRTYSDPWTYNDYGLDMSAGHDLVVNSWRKVTVDADSLLVPPQSWASLDYRTIDEPGVSGELRWEAARHGMAHGIAVWFDAELADGIGFSNAPSGQELIYGQAFFPLEKAVELAEGDSVSVRLRANLVEGEYVWQWDTKITSGRGDGARSKADFRQSTFRALDLSPDTLRKRRDDFAPSLSLDGLVDAAVLSAMRDGRQLKEIADDLASRFPERFATARDALDRVAALSVKYSL
jgi:type I protein arginine methyltransferase